MAKKIETGEVTDAGEELFVQEYNALCEKHGKIIIAETRLIVQDLPKPKDDSEIKTA